MSSSGVVHDNSFLHRHGRIRRLARHGDEVMGDKNIAIPVPVAEFGERVLVYNYRKRSHQWETGVVTSLWYSRRYGAFSWRYEVATERKTKSGHHLRLVVPGEYIKPVEV